VDAANAALQANRRKEDIDGDQIVKQP